MYKGFDLFRRMSDPSTVVSQVAMSFHSWLVVRTCRWPLKTLSAMLLSLASLFFMSGCSDTPVRERLEVLEGATMGTTFTIRYVSETTSTEPHEIERLIELELDTVNQQMSTYLPDSEISLFSASRSTDWFAVSAETAQVVELAQQISEISHGAFDVTVAPLVNLWGFGPGKQAAGVPSESEIEAARACVGYQQLEVRLDPPAVKKAIPELQIDLSAIAKGHGVDRVGLVLSKNGIQNYFVEIGGEIVTRGTRQDGKPWRVGIESPQREKRSIQMILELSNAAIATSGNYRNYFEYNEQYYSHTIDPETGRPVIHPLVSASVVADNCMLADAIATCMMVLGHNEGLKVANERGWMVMLFHDEGGKLLTTTSDTFSKCFPNLKHLSIDKK